MPQHVHNRGTSSARFMILSLSSHSAALFIILIREQPSPAALFIILIREQRSPPPCLFVPVHLSNNLHCSLPCFGFLFSYIKKGSDIRALRVCYVYSDSLLDRRSPSLYSGIMMLRVLHRHVRSRRRRGSARRCRLRLMR